MRRLINGTGVAWRGQGILILGPTGSGKSDLTLRLIDAGARLIADDVVEMKREGDLLLLSFPPEGPANLRGRMEVKGLGIMSVPTAPPDTPLALVVEATPPERVELIPESLQSEWLGLAVTTLRIPLLEPSAPAKVRLALAKPTRSIIPPS
ncbi:MAG TPA: HPr kinase/phosphatase C-terminal domain-containing protein [Dongiaceae bacterium]